MERVTYHKNKVIFIVFVIRCAFILSRSLNLTCKNYAWNAIRYAFILCRSLNKGNTYKSGKVLHRSGKVLHPIVISTEVGDAVAAEAEKSPGRGRGLL